MKRIFTFLVSVFLCGVVFGQYPTIYATLGSGSWATQSNWETFTGNATNTPGASGSGTPATTVPSGTHHVYIRSGHAITMGGANRSCLGLTVEATGSLLAGETTARRLQIGNGGTGFTYPQTGVVTNNGTIGGPTDGIFFENGTNAAVVTLTGTGVYQVQRLRMPGGMASDKGGAVQVNIDQNITFTQAANYALSAVYNPAVTDNYVVNINAGKTVTIAGTGYFHNGVASTVAGGNYTYNILGTLDLSGSTGNTNITPLSSPGSTVALNISGTLKLGSGLFSTDTSTNGAGGTTFGKVRLNISNTGVVDATLANGTFRTGVPLQQYFVLAGNGTLKRQAASTETLYPVGTSTTNYNPVILANGGTTDNFSVIIKNTIDNSVTDATRVVNKQWTITEDAAGGSNATISLGWVTADQASAFNPAAGVVIARWTGSGWETKTATVIGTGTTTDPYIATATGFTAFSSFIVANAAALPVKFSGVNAQAINNTVKLNWKIATEINTAYYQVERSADGKLFESIGSVVANNAGSYNWIDNAPAKTTAYYRIKAVDKDGSFMYSTIVVVNLNSKAVELTVAPNPVRDRNVKVQMANFEKGNYTLRVIANNGQVVYQSVMVNDGGIVAKTLQLPAGIATGIYRLQVSNGSTQVTKNLIVE